MIMGYTRVSTEEQRGGVSLDAQIKQIRLYAELNHLTPVVLVTDEGISAKNLNRPGVQEVLRTAKLGELQHVIIYRLDRMFRDARDALNANKLFEQKGAILHSVTERLDTSTPAGKLYFTLVAAFAEMERNMISARTKEALAHIRAEGKRVGEVPYGFDLQLSGQLVANREEQQALKLIDRLRKNGRSSRSIAKELTRRKVPTKKGKRTWCHTSVQRILNRGW